MQYEKLGIIPVAGTGSRWGGYFKELLPIGDNRWLIDSVIESMVKVKCDRICIITSKEKIDFHVRHFQKEKYKDLNIFYVLNRENEMWGSIKESLLYSGKINYFAMPDTMIPVNSFPSSLTSPFMLGLFETKNTERFGVVKDGKVINKEKLPEGVYKAWGTLCWNDDISQLLLEAGDVISDYTEAINFILNKYVCHSYKLDFYYDFSKFYDYKEYIKECL